MIEDACERYLGWLEGTGAAAATIRTRRKALAGFVRWGAGHGVLEPRNVTLAVVEGYQLVLARGRRKDGAPLAVGTQSLGLTAVRQFARWMVRVGELPYDPTEGLRLPRRPTRLPRVVLTASEVERVLRYFREAGVARSGSCHVFRHTMATLLLENGADIRALQEMLGHASLATTAIYTHVAIGRLKQIHAATHPAERGAPGPPTDTETIR